MTDPQHVFGVELLVDADGGFTSRFPDLIRLPETPDAEGRMVPISESDAQYAARLATLGRALVMQSTQFGTDDQVRLFAEAKAKGLPILLLTQAVPEHRRLREPDLTSDQARQKGIDALKAARARDAMTPEQRAVADGAY